MGSEGFVTTRFKHTIQCLLHNYTEGKEEKKKIQDNIVWFKYKLAFTYCKNIGMQYIQTHTS